MKLLKRIYLNGLVKASIFNVSCFSIFYKVLFFFNYNFFFFFKLAVVKAMLFRLYLLNSNFYFIFTDYIYLINYINHLNKGNVNLSTLPIKLKSYSVLRSPFVNSKSREHFMLNYYCIFFNIKL